MSDFYVFNGKICKVHSGHDDGVGVVITTKQKTFDGDYYECNSTTQPLAQWADETIRFNKVNLRFYIDDEPINDPTVALENYIIYAMGGDVDSTFHGVYSDLTGHLWTEEQFKVGGHDIIKILKSNNGKYLHMEVEVVR